MHRLPFQGGVPGVLKDLRARRVVRVLIMKYKTAKRDLELRAQIFIC